MPSEPELYSRGEFYLDYLRGKDGKIISPNFYIFWYDPAAGRLQRRSTRESDLQLAEDALDRHYLAVHRPADDDRAAYTVHDAMADYWTQHGADRPSADAIRARLKLINRFMAHEIKEGLLREPVLPRFLDDQWLVRFRKWATEIDPIVQRRRDPTTGEWTVSTRKRSRATAEESIIQLKAALNFNEKRMPSVPKLQHLTRAAVTPERGYRLSLDQIAEMLDYTALGDSRRSAAHQVRLIPLRRYLIGAICTLGRPDAIYDISVLDSRHQWHRSARVLDLNPEGRIQTRKHRPAIPIADLLAEWLSATDDRLVCQQSIIEQGGDRYLAQRPVTDIKKAWSVMARKFGVPIGYGSKLMRHSVSTLLAERGVPPTEISLALGHAILPPSTRKYVVFSPQYLAQTKQAINDLVSDLTRKTTAPLRPTATQVGPDGKRRPSNDVS